MKYFKAISAVFCAAVLTCSGAFTACNTPTPKPQQPPVTDHVFYTITADYNSEEGNVALSHTSAEEGTEVTVTVTANEGYAIDWVSAEPPHFSSIHYVELDENGVGTFTMYGDATVVHARFKSTEEVPPMSEGEYSVTVSLSGFAAAHGRLELTAPAEGEKYAAGEEVTLTATPNEGYEAAVVTVNGNVVKLTEGAYTFPVQEDIIVSATFSLATGSLPEVSGLPTLTNSFAALFRSHWLSVGGETPLYIGTNKMSLGEHAIASVEPSGSSGEQMYRFAVGGTTYTLSWLNFSYSMGYVLHLLNYDTEESTYFVKNPLPAVEIEEKYNGDWVDEVTDVTLNIKDNEICYSDMVASVVVDLGYYDVSADEFRGPIDAHMYYFFVNGKPYLLGWYPDGPNPTVNARSYVAQEERVYNFSEAFRGTWKSLDGQTEIVITETLLTVNGTEIAVRGYNEYMFYLTLDGVQYEARVSMNSDYVLELSHELLNDAGLWMGSEYRYFVSSQLPAVTVDPSLYGVWKAAAGYSTDDITISAAGIVWGNDVAVVISAGEARSDGYTYTIAVRDAIYTVSILNLWAGYESESDIPEGLPEWLFALDGAGYYYEFTADTSAN